MLPLKKCLCCNRKRAKRDYCSCCYYTFREVIYRFSPLCFEYAVEKEDGILLFATRAVWGNSVIKFPMHQVEEGVRKIYERALQESGTGTRDIKCFLPVMFTFYERRGKAICIPVFRVVKQSILNWKHHYFVVFEKEDFERVVVDLKHIDLKRFYEMCLQLLGRVMDRVSRIYKGNLIKTREWDVRKEFQEV